jgi:hypothetical protein
MKGSTRPWVDGQRTRDGIDGMEGPKGVVAPQLPAATWEVFESTSYF